MGPPRFFVESPRMRQLRGGHFKRLAEGNECPIYELLCACTCCQPAREYDLVEETPRGQASGAPRSKDAISKGESLKHKKGSSSEERRSSRSADEGDSVQQAQRILSWAETRGSSAASMEAPTDAGTASRRGPQNSRSSSNVLETPDQTPPEVSPSLTPADVTPRIDSMQRKESRPARSPGEGESRKTTTSLARRPGPPRTAAPERGSSNKHAQERESNRIDTERDSSKVPPDRGSRKHLRPQERGSRDLPAERASNEQGSRGSSKRLTDREDKDPRMRASDRGDRILSHTDDAASRSNSKPPRHKESNRIRGSMSGPDDRARRRAPLKDQEVPETHGDPAADRQRLQAAKFKGVVELAVPEPEAPKAGKIEIDVAGLTYVGISN